VALFGLSTIGFGLSTSLYLSLACLALIGAADMVNVYVPARPSSRPRRRTRCAAASRR
jgi:hypothetical protein